MIFKFNSLILISRRISIVLIVKLEIHPGKLLKRLNPEKVNLLKKYNYFILKTKIDVHELITIFQFIFLFSKTYTFLYSKLISLN